MTQPIDYTEMLVHTCPDCPNLYLLTEQDQPYHCPRDKGQLIQATREITDWITPRHARVCGACGRLSKIQLAHDAPCILCDSPRHLEIQTPEVV